MLFIDLQCHTILKLRSGKLFIKKVTYLTKHAIYGKL